MTTIGEKKIGRILLSITVRQNGPDVAWCR
jgi:hypothetical protein